MVQTKARIELIMKGKHLFLQALQHIVCLCSWNTVPVAHEAKKVEQGAEYLLLRV